jgi:hypothetical protein
LLRLALQPPRSSFHPARKFVSLSEKADVRNNSDCDIRRRKKHRNDQDFRHIVLAAAVTTRRYGSTASA